MDAPSTLSSYSSGQKDAMLGHAGYTGLAWLTGTQMLCGCSLSPYHQVPSIANTIQYFQHTPVNWHANGKVFQGKMVGAG